MDNKNTSTNFEYTYSSKQQAEIDEIRRKYLLEKPKEEDKLEKLHRLDKSAEQKGTMISIIMGVVFTLIFGLGICCVLEWEMFLIGTVSGFIGVAGIIAAYPVYKKVTEIQRAKIAPEILRLTDELKK